MTYQTRVRILQGGSQMTLASSGTLVVHPGGSIQVESGAVLFIASGGSVINNGAEVIPGALSLGGTAGRWSFGTAGLASGVGTVATGIPTVVSAWGASVSGVQGGAGSMSSVVVDLSLGASGSVIFRGLAGTLAFTGNNGTVAWAAFGQ